MAKKKGYQLLDVPNNKRGRRFFEDFKEFMNKDWYGYHRRGRLPKPGVKLNWQGQAQVEDSSRWAIYVRGVPAPRKFIEHSKLQRARIGYKYFSKLYDKTALDNEELRNKVDKLKKEVGEWHKTYVKMHGVGYRRLNTYKISLFGWNISLWRDDKEEIKS